MGDELGESLPSESLLVPHSSPRKHHHTVGNDKEKSKYSFLKKGSRKEPSALMGYSKPQQIHNSDELEESILEASLISNSDLLGDTTNSDIHNKWLENRKQAQMELHEFEMIERDLDKIAVVPLLMSIEGLPPDESHNHSASKVKGDHHWIDKSAEYYLGQGIEENKPRNSPKDSHKMREFLGEGQKTYVDYDEKFDPNYESDEYLQDEINDEDFEHLSPHVHQLSIEKPTEEETSALVTDTKFLRVSQSDIPFRDSSKTSDKIPLLYNYVRPPTVDDSLSWNDGPRNESAIRPSLQNRSSSEKEAIQPKKSVAAPRYQTFHQSSGAIDDVSSEWNRKSHENNVRNSMSKRNASRPSSAGHLRSSQRNRTDEISQSQSNTSKSKVILDEEIIMKAKRLEEEILIYQKENSQIKSLRKQHEAALAEIHDQKQQLKDWIEEEKRKTEKWCEETKEAAKKEKRAAAQYMRDARNASLSSSVRKDRGEIDALQATITKMTLEHAEIVKKLKANVSRLQQTNKTQSETISQLESQVAKFELEKLRGSTKLQIDSSSSRSMNHHVKRNFDHSFVEEVDASEHVIWNSTHTSRQSINSKPKDNFESSSLSEKDFDDDLKSNGSIVEFGTAGFDISEAEADMKYSSYDPSRYHKDSEFRRDSSEGPDKRQITTGNPSSVAPRLSSDKLRFESSNKERVVEIDPSGVKITRYSNGTVKYNFPDGVSEVRFTNGDVKKQIPKDSTLVYFYAQANTTHTTYADGTEIYEFPSGQVEKHFPNGQKIVTFPDGTIKTIFPDGNQESVFPDGVVVKEFPNGKKEILEPTDRKH